MRNILGYIIRYHFFLLFILLEILCVFLIVKHNQFHNSRFVNYAQSVSGAIDDKSNQIKYYFKLRKTNEKLIAENNELYNTLFKVLELDDNQTAMRILKDSVKSLIISLKSFEHHPTAQYADTSQNNQYEFIHAKVVNNSTNKRHNYITLNKGYKDSIGLEMAVISNYGVVGIINRVSHNFSTAISILNPRLRISAKIKKNNYFGSLYWEGRDISECILSEIPQHVDVEKGDTIVTSGYSAIFPEGFLIGFVDDFELEEGNFYKIRVKLALDMKNLANVNIIKNRFINEQIELEELNENQGL